MLAFAVGCAGPDWKPSGFLGSDYSEFSTQSGSLIYRRPGRSLAPYDKVLLDRVEIWLDDESRTDLVPWPEVRLYAETFQEALENTLGDDYPLVDEPGEGVLHVRVALTDVEVDGRGYATRENLGYGNAATVDDIAFETTRLRVKGIAVEAEFLDSVTGERLVAVLARRSSGSGGKWDAVQEIFARWAQGIRQALDDSRS